MNTLGAEYRPWPDPASFTYSSIKIGNDYHRLYNFRDGPQGLPGVTTVCKVFAKPALIDWAARTERAYALEAMRAEWKERGPSLTAAGFCAKVEQRMGEMRAHERIRDHAADIGTEIHAAVNRYLQRQMGAELPEPELSEPAQMGLRSFQDWWIRSGYTPFLMEQPFWSSLGFAGRFDLLAIDKHQYLDVVDIKSSKGIYDDHHIQVGGGYLLGLREYCPVRGAVIVRLPKSADDLTMEVTPAGRLYDADLTLEELQELFMHGVAIWTIRYAPKEGQ